MIRNNVLACLLLIFLILSCSDSKPQISDLKVKLLKLQTKSDGIVERLSVFLEYDDENGQNDFGSLDVLHEKTGLHWTIKSSDISFFTFQGFSENHYIAGTNKITPPLYKMPLGHYKIKIIDLGHNEHLLDYTLNNLDITNELPFDISIDGSEYILKTKNIIEFTDYSIILLGADRQTIKVEQKKLSKQGEDRINFTEIKKTFPDSRYFQIMFEKKEFAFLSKIYNLETNEND